MEYSILFITILLIIGLLIGIVSTIVGQGGGGFYVPAIMLLLICSISIAIDTSNYVILWNSAAGFITYLKEKRTNIKIPLIYSSFAILGSMLSMIMLALITIEEFILQILFTSLLCIIGINMLYKAIHTKFFKNPNCQTTEDLAQNIENGINYMSFIESCNHFNLKKGIPLFILAGFASNLLGIGGGLVNGPTLNIVMGFPIHNATAVSTSMTFFVSIFIVIIKIFFGNIDYIVGTILGISSILGAIIGATISQRVPKFYLQIIIAGLLFFFAFRIYI